MPDPCRQARGQDQETINIVPEQNVQTMSINSVFKLFVTLHGKRNISIVSY